MSTVETFVELPSELQQYLEHDLPRMHGWLSAKKVGEAARAIIQMNARAVIEIGVYAGRNLIGQAITLKHLGNNGRIIGIDPWSNDAAVKGFNDANVTFWSKVDLEMILHSCQRGLRLRGLDPWVEIIRATSDAAFEELKLRNLVVDVLIIDGNHSEDQSCRDVRNYLPMMRPGGHVFFDDADWAQTQGALDLIFESCDSIGLIEGSMAHFVKR